MSIVEEFDLPLKRLVNVSTDGCRSMTGVHNGFTALLKEKVPHILLNHCLIHVQALVGKNIDLDLTMQQVVQVLSRILSSKLDHRKFQSLCQELDANYSDLLYFTSVRWLSKGACLVRFIELIEEIRAYLVKVDFKKEFEYVFEEHWLCRVKFLADICAVFNQCNVAMQKKDNGVCDLVHAINSFRTKIGLRAEKFAKRDFKNFKYLSTCHLSDIISNEKSFTECFTSLEAALNDRLCY